MRVRVFRSYKFVNTVCKLVNVKDYSLSLCSERSRWVDRVASPRLTIYPFCFFFLHEYACQILSHACLVLSEPVFGQSQEIY